MNRFFDLLHLFLGDCYVIFYVSSFKFKNIMTTRGNLGSKLANFVKQNVCKILQNRFFLG